MVGTLSSYELQALVAEHVDPRFVADVYFFLYATSQAHVTRLKVNINKMVGGDVRNMSEAAYYAGKRVINSLNKTLSPRALTTLSKEAHYISGHHRHNPSS